MLVPGALGHSLHVAPLAHPKTIRTSCQKKRVFLWIWLDSTITGHCDASFGDTANYSPHTVFVLSRAGQGNWCTLTRLRELIHMSLVVCLNCRNVPYNWNSIKSESITLPSQKPPLAGMAGDSLPSCFILVHMRLHILSYPGSRSEEKLWWRKLFPAILEQKMICLRYSSSPSLTFQSVKGWLEPGLLELCSRCHRWASLFLLPWPWSHRLHQEEEQEGFLACLGRDRKYYPSKLTVLNL